MEDTGEQLDSQDSEEAKRAELFRLIQKIAKDNPDANQRILKTYIGGRVDFGDLAKILEGKPYIDIKDIFTGDTLVFNTDSESSFYFRVKKGIDEKNNYAKGDLRRVSKDGEVKDYFDVVFQGTTLGTAMTPDRLFVNGFPAQFRIPTEADSMSNEERAKLIEEKGPEAILPKILRTSPLKDAQIIRAETIENQSASNN